jgi:excisionase family DNA binding protein
MTLSELASYLNVNPRTVRRWLPQGLPALNVGSRQRPDWRFIWPEVRTWLDDRQRQRPADAVSSGDE